MSKQYIIKAEDVINSLDSDYEDVPLSANQGRILNSSLVDTVYSVEDAGKVLGIGDDGMVVPVAVEVKYKIVATCGPNGMITPIGEIEILEGESQTFTIAPSGGFTIADVLVDGISIGAVSEYTFEDVQSDHTIEATFKLPPIYTMFWTEGSISANIQYADDAGTMTEAQRNELIKDHCHFAVVKWDGTKPVVNYYLYRDNLNYKATDATCKESSGVASVLTGADGDVMLLYDRVWWKVTISSSSSYRVIQISFTWDEPSGSEWVTPHRYGDSLSSTSLATYVGLGVFEGYITGSQLRSVNTSSTPTTSTSQNNFYNAAVYNRNWQYNNQLPMTYAWYVMQLYFVKGNRDVQMAYGYGLVDTTKSAVNKNWSATNAWNNGTTANQTTGVTALGIQNAWGNVMKFMGETRYDNKVYRFTTLGGKDHNNIESGYSSTWKSVTVTNTISGYNITQINGTPEYPFFPNAGSGSTYSQYYGDYGYQSTSTARCVGVGGLYSNRLNAGALNVLADATASASVSSRGARLHVLII